LERVRSVRLRILRVELPHVVRVHEPARFIESAYWRPRVWLIADVPFPEYGGSVTTGFEHFAHRGEARLEPSRARPMRAEDFGAARVASAKQSGAGCGTDGLRHVEVMKRAAFGGQTFDIRGGVAGLAEWTAIGPARI